MAPTNNKRRKGKQGGRSTPLPGGIGGDDTALAYQDRAGAGANDNDGSVGVATAGASTGVNNDAAVSPDMLDLILTSEKRRGVYECDYCHADISRFPRIRCAECLDFDLCLDCFCTTDHGAAVQHLKAALNVQSALHEEDENADDGTLAHAQTLSTTAAALQHDDSHGYRVCDSTRYPLFPSVRNMVMTVSDNAEAVPAAAGAPVFGARGAENAGADCQGADIMHVDADRKIAAADADPESGDASQQPAITTTMSTKFVPDGDPKHMWTVEEDLRLLEGIATHGLGNWVEISEAVSGQGSAGKMPKRCWERYFDDFLGRYGHILPPYTLSMERGELEDEEAEDTDAYMKRAANSSGTSSTDGTDTQMVEMVTASNDGADVSNADKPAEATEGPQEGGAAAAAAKPGSPPGDTTPPRAFKRRATMMRSPTALSNLPLVARRQFTVVETEKVESMDKLWPRPYVPPIGGVRLGQEVGREQFYKAEQAYVRQIGALEKVEEVEVVRQEWAATQLDQPGGPRVLPPRPDDIVKMPGSDLVGFMPRRGDFDIEYHNDAEEAVADMELIAGEPAADRELKMQVLAIYSRRLVEREERKQFILSRGLHDYRKRQAEEQKLPRDERDLLLRMRLFERFHSPEEHKHFVDDLLKAKRLRKEIAKLQMYRRMGIRTLEEAEKFEIDKNRRQYHKIAQQQKSTESAAVAAAPSTATAQPPTFGTEMRRASSYDDGSCHSLWKQYKTTARRRSRSPHDASEAQASPRDVPSPSQPTASNENFASVDAMDVDNAPKAESEQGHKTHYASKSTEKGKEAMDVDSMSGLAGYHLLSTKEIDLCHKLQLTPEQYLDIKRALVYESLHNGLLASRNSNTTASHGVVDGVTATGPSGANRYNRRTIVKMDVVRRGNVIDFMLRAGWISAQLGDMARQLPHVVEPDDSSGED